MTLKAHGGALRFLLVVIMVKFEVRPDSAMAVFEIALCFKKI